MSGTAHRLDGTLTARARLRAWRRSRRVKRAARLVLVLLAVSGATVAADFGYQVARDWQAFERFKEANTAKAARMATHAKAMFDELCVKLAPHKRDSRAEKICAAVIEESLAAGVPPADGLAVVKIESDFNLAAMSAAGAFGLTQMRLAVHQPGSACDLAMDARCNLRAGFAYYNHLLAAFGGNQRLALTAFNRGPGTVRAAQREGEDPDNGYFQRWRNAREAAYAV
jgi:hypothetical protein